MWPFGKKSRTLELPPRHEQSWSVAVAEDDGGALVVRCNQTARTWAGHADFPIRLGFAIPFNHPNERELPSPEENAQLAPIEDLIADNVAAAIAGVHTLTLTSGVMKEMVFYIAPGADIAKLHQGIQAQVSSHQVQCIAEDDPQWEVYRAYLS